MRARIGRRPGFSTRGFRGLGDEGSLTGNTAAIQCIDAQQKIYINSTVSDYLKQLIYDSGSPLSAAQKQWCQSQWQALQDQITNTYTPQNFSACNASADYAQKAGYSENDPITNILSAPYQNQILVDGSGYTVAQMVAVGKQKIDYYLFGHSQFGPDVQGTAPQGIIQYVDIPTHTLKTVAVGVNTGLSPAQIASPAYTTDQQRLFQAGANAQQLAANNPGTAAPPNVSVPVPAALADNGQIVPATYSTPAGLQQSGATPAVPASPSAIASSIDSSISSIPTWEWLTGAAVVAIPFLLRGLSGLGDLQAQATAVAQSNVFHPAHLAFLKSLLATPGLNSGQQSYLNTMIGYANEWTGPFSLAQYPPDIQAAALAATTSSSPAPSLSPTYVDGHFDTLGTVIAADQNSILNTVKAYAGTTGQALFNQTQQQFQATDAADNAIASQIATDVVSGTNFTLPGSGPIPAQYQPQNLPKQPAAQPLPAGPSPTLTLPPGGYNLQSPNPTAPPTNPLPAPAPTTTDYFGLGALLSNPLVWLGGGAALLFAFSGSGKRR